MFRAELYQKTSQRLWSRSLSLLHFAFYLLFLKPVTRIKRKSKFKGKWWHRQTEGTFLWSGLCIRSYKTIAYVIDKQSCVCMPSVKTTTYLCNGLHTSFCTKDDETHQTISNLNRKFRKKDNLLRFFLIHLSYRDFEFYNHTFIWILISTYLASWSSSL